MKKNLRLFVVALLAMACMSSCTIAKISGKGAVPILLNQTDQKMELVEHIQIKKNSNFDWTSSFDASEVLSAKVVEKKPDAVINTTITIQSDIDNFLINLITLGLAQSRKIVIEADLMMYKQAVQNK